MIPAAMYLRCSTDGQADDSPSQQRSSIHPYARTLGFIIEKEYSDIGKSGTSFDRRSGFQQMLHDVRSGKATYKAVFCYDMSRWGRATNPDENIYFKVEFERHGVQVIFVKTAVDRKHPFAGVMGAVEASIASEESKKRGELTERGQRANAERGLSTGGTALYGYTRQAINRATSQPTRLLVFGTHCSPDEKVTITPVPYEAAVVKRIFSEALDGVGLGSIAHMLNAEGIPPPANGRSRNRDGKWSLATVQSILRNRAYTGTRIYGRVTHDPGRVHFTRTDPSTWTVHPNAHEAIISQSTFDAVQRRFQKRRQGMRHDSVYLLAGLIRCTHCGFAYHGVYRTRKNRTKEPYRLGLYVCGGNHGKGKSVCPGLAINKDEVEAFVIRSIEERIRRSGYIDVVEQTIVDRLGNPENHDEYTMELDRQLEVNRKATRTLLNLVESGSELPELHQSILRLETERKRLLAEAAKINTSHIARDDIEALVFDIKVLVRDFVRTFARAKTQIQKSMIRKFVDSIVVNPDTHEVVVHMRAVPTVDNPLSGRITGSGGAEIVKVPRTVTLHCFTNTHKLYKGTTHEEAK